MLRGMDTGPAFAFSPSQRYPDPRVEALDPRFLSLRLVSATVEQLCSGLRWAEGRFAAAIAQEGELVDASLTLLGIAGGASVPEHSHDDAWELLVILQGAGTMTLGSGDAQRTIEVRPGSTLRIPRAVPHAFVASPGDAVIAVQLYTPPGAEQRFKKLAAE
mgnify:CR=1 FL=1